MTVSGDSYAFFWVVSEIVAPSNRGEDDVAKFFLELVIGMEFYVFCGVAFPLTDIAEYFSHAHDNLSEGKFLISPNITTLLE